MKKVVLKGIGITAILGMVAVEALASYSTVPTDRITASLNAEKTSIIQNLERLATAAPTLSPMGGVLIARGGSGGGGGGGDSSGGSGDGAGSDSGGSAGGGTGEGTADCDGTGDDTADGTADGIADGIGDNIGENTSSEGLANRGTGINHGYGPGDGTGDPENQPLDGSGYGPGTGAGLATSTEGTTPVDVEPVEEKTVDESDAESTPDTVSTSA